MHLSSVKISMGYYSLLSHNDFLLRKSCSEWNWHSETPALLRAFTLPGSMKFRSVERLEAAGASVQRNGETLPYGIAEPSGVACGWRGLGPLQGWWGRADTNEQPGR